MIETFRRRVVRLAAVNLLLAVIDQPCSGTSLSTHFEGQEPSQSPPHFMVRLLTEDDLAGMTAAELDLMRNEIYARLGRRFSRADLKAHFESQAWYRPRFAPNDFDTNLLSSIQSRNVALLLTAAQRARQASPAVTGSTVREPAPGASTQETALVLDKLTACADIERVYTALKAAPKVSPSECRPPRAGLEATLASRAGAGASRLCYLRASPAAFLDSFSCVRFIADTATSGAADMTCFRAAAMRDVQDYKERYAERFARIESQYLAAAQKCAVSAGDSGNAAPVIFPPVASMLASFQLGFVASLGSGRPSDSSVFHGYGSTDPSISGSAPSAIEVVSVIVNSPARRSVPLSSAAVGDWLLEVDDTATLEREMNDRYADAGARMRFSVASVNLAREGPHGVTQSAKLALTSSIHDSIARELEADGFEQMSESEILRNTGKSSKEIAREMGMNSVPFGSRDRGVRLSESFRMLLKETGFSCTRQGRGAIAVYLTGTQPTAGVERDFGDITLIAARMGACSYNSDARSYINGLIGNTLDHIRDALRGR